MRKGERVFALPRTTHIETWPAVDGRSLALVFDAGGGQLQSVHLAATQVGPLIRGLARTENMLAARRGEPAPWPELSADD